MRRSQRNIANYTEDDANAIITIADPFHDKPFEATATGHTSPSIVRTVTRSITIRPSATLPFRSFCVGGMPVGTMSTFNTNDYVDTVYPSASASSNAVDPTRDVLEFDAHYYLATSTSNRPYRRTIGSVGGSRFVEIPLPTGNALGDGMIYPFMAPVFVVASNDATFAFDKTGWAAPLVTNPNKKAYGVALFGETSFYDDGPTRMISCAYEIHNVSSALNRQGTITVGDIGMRGMRTYGSFYGALTNSTALNPVNMISTDVMHYGLAPATAAELLALPSSKQWSSEYGVYAVYPPTNECNDFESPSSKLHVQSQAFYGDTECPPKAACNTIPSGNKIAVATVSACPANDTGTIAYGVRPTNCPQESFSPVYTFVDGLSDSSVFTITVRITYETIPFVRSPLISLARLPYLPTPTFEHVLHSVFAQLHPYCMVSENAKGTWFKKVLGVAKKVLPIYNATRGLLPEPARQIGDIVANQVKKKTKKKPKAKASAQPQAQTQSSMLKVLPSQKTARTSNPRSKN